MWWWIDVFGGCKFVHLLVDKFLRGMLRRKLFLSFYYICESPSTHFNTAGRWGGDSEFWFRCVGTHLKDAGHWPLGADVCHLGGIEIVRKRILKDSTLFIFQPCQMLRLDFQKIFIAKSELQLKRIFFFQSCFQIFTRHSKHICSIFMFLLFIYCFVSYNTNL